MSKYDEELIEALVFVQTSLHNRGYPGHASVVMEAVSRLRQSMEKPTSPTVAPDVEPTIKECVAAMCRGGYGAVSDWSVSVRSASLQQAMSVEDAAILGEGYLARERRDAAKGGGS